MADQPLALDQGGAALTVSQQGYGTQFERNGCWRLPSILSLGFKSFTVWLSLDGADADSGAVALLPGTHRSLLGEWQKGFHGLRGSQDSLDTSQAMTLVTPPRHFHIFHSWVVHCSLTNNSRKPRSALILRYMDRRHAVHVSFPHEPCGLNG